jgi:CelD/BcsL family acetyltransferase involved in cellulose biosynthesis
LRVCGLRDARGFAGLKVEWDRLLDAGDAGIFSAWEWLYPWFRRIGTDSALRLMLVRNEEDVLVGLLPCTLSMRGPLRLRRLGFLGETHVGSDHLGPLAVRGQEREVASILAGSLFEARGEWDVLDFVDIDEDAPWIDALSERFSGSRWCVEVTPRFTCPYAALPEGQDFDAFLKGTARRDNYLRRRKWLEHQPGFVFERTVDPLALTWPMAEFFRLHRLRWESDGGSQGIKGPGVEAFHRDAAQLLAARGQLRLHTLRVGGAAVASVYGIRCRDRFLYFQSGYDPAWRERSVGLVLVGETFRAALAEGCREYDFLRGTEGYKYDWVTRERRTVAVRVYARDGRGAWLSREEQLSRNLRHAVQRSIPSSWTEGIRRWRRRRAQV